MSSWSVTCLSVTWACVLFAVVNCSTDFNLAVVATTGASDVELVPLETDGQEIVGLGRLNNRLYAVCLMNNTIFVFDDQAPYSRVELITIPTLSGMGPGDLVADPVNQRLYIIDWRSASDGGSRVWSVDPFNETAQYYVNATGWTGTLSLTQDQRLLAVSGNNKLNLYSSSNPTALDLPAEIIAPQHAVRTQRGTYYVSQGWTTGQAHRINEVDTTGATISRQYGDSEPGNETNQLYWPRYIATDSDDERVYVADYCNGRILKLNANLTSSSVLVSARTTPGFGWPTRLLRVLRPAANTSATSSHLFVAMAKQPPSYVCTVPTATSATTSTTTTLSTTTSLSCRPTWNVLVVLSAALFCRFVAP